MISDITPLILTYNEAPNLRRTLEKLSWAKEVVIVDSFSTDETIEIAGGFSNVRVVQRRFDDHTTQWNFGLAQIETEWVLTLDADYVLTELFLNGLRELPMDVGLDVFYARFRYCILGRPLRASLYPPRAVLFRRSVHQYQADGHTQLLNHDGPQAFIPGVIYHDDRKPLERWVMEQNRYMVREAAKLLATPLAQLKLADRLRRRIWIAPGLVFLYTLFAKGLIFGGWPAWYYVSQRVFAELLLSLRLLEARLQAPSTDANPVDPGNRETPNHRSDLGGSQ